MHEFCKLCKNWNGDLNTAYPLIVAFSNDLIAGVSIEQYHNFGWSVINKLHSLNMNEWQVDIPKDPEEVGWPMYFSGMPLFINMSTPAHKHRKSCSLGNNFSFVINLREQFDIVAGNNPQERNIRNNIRQRINI